MIAICVYRGAVNVRPSPALDNTPLFMTSSPDFARLLGTTAIKGDTHIWLHVEFDDGRQGYTRADVSFVVGDLTLLGGPKLTDVTLATVAFQPTGATNSATQTATNPTTPTGSSGTTNTATSGASKWACPVTPFIFTEGYGGASGHHGYDLAATDGKRGSPVTASAVGVVYVANKCQKCAGGNGSVVDSGLPLNSPSVLNDPFWGWGFGNYVVVRYAADVLPAGAPGPWLFVCYAHLDSLKVKAGDTVAAGTIVGLRGNSGNSSGVHLHLELHSSTNSKPTNVFAEALVDPAKAFAI